MNELKTSDWDSKKEKLSEKEMKPFKASKRSSEIC